MVWTGPVELTKYQKKNAGFYFFIKQQCFHLKDILYQYL